MFKMAVGLLGTANRHLFTRSQNLLSRYGDKDSFVVVTGGSDGIGLEICYQMAAQGFNICIIGRNEDKIIKALDAIKTKYAQI